MARLHYLLLFSYLVLPTMQTIRHGIPAELLHVNQQDEWSASKNDMQIIDLNNFESAGRMKRSLSTASLTLSSTYPVPNSSFKQNKNITTKVSFLSDNSKKKNISLIRFHYA